MLAFLYADKPVGRSEIRELLVRAIVATSTDDDVTQSAVARLLAESFRSLIDADEDEPVSKRDSELLDGKAAEEEFRDVAYSAYAKRLKRKREDIDEDGSIFTPDCFYGSEADIWSRGVVRDAAQAVGEHEAEKLKAFGRWFEKEKAAGRL